MKAFLDTSVLVAAFYGDHVQHTSSLRVFASATPEECACGAHSLAKVYAVMTRLPVRPPIGPDQALLFVDEMVNRLTIITLTQADYHTVLRDAAARGIGGGRIYDTILLRCAAVAEAETIYTWNVAHFRAIAPELSDRIRTPA